MGEKTNWLDSIDDLLLSVFIILSRTNEIVYKDENLEQKWRDADNGETASRYDKKIPGDKSWVEDS